MFTQAQVNAFGRNVLSGLSGAASVLVVMHLASSSDSSTVQAGATDIIDGLEKVFSGVLILAPVIMGKIAAWTASHPKQLEAVQKAIDAGALQGVAIVKTDSKAGQ